MYLPDAYEVFKSKPHHSEDCGFERCVYCGCCAHGKTNYAGCKVDDAPSGMSCANGSCGCEGRA